MTRKLDATASGSTRMKMRYPVHIFSQSSFLFISGWNRVIVSMCVFLNSASVKYGSYGHMAIMAIVAIDAILDRGYQLSI